MTAVGDLLGPTLDVSHSECLGKIIASARIKIRHVEGRKEKVAGKKVFVLRKIYLLRRKCLLGRKER